MKVGLFGLPYSGKTTVFKALSGFSAQTDGKSKEANRAVVKVPDARIDELAKIYNPKKTTYATVEYIDMAGVHGKKSSSFWGTLRATDVLVHIVRAFEDLAVPHIHDSIDFLRDIREINAELVFADFAVVENNLDKLERSLKSGKKSELLLKKETLLKCKDALENETPLRSLNLNATELEAIRNYQFLTLKPFITVVNLGEDAEPKEYLNKIKDDNVLYLHIKGKLEMEIAQLDPEEQSMFLEEMGIEELALNRFIRESFELLGLISFFTVGSDEVRAWPIRNGTKAVRAAGSIHSDLERGFIRAETFHYNDLLEAQKDPKKLKEMGKHRLEGKEYLVADGDVINVRFNVS